MHPVYRLIEWLSESSNQECYLFSLRDIQGFFPHSSVLAVKTLLSRAVSSGYLSRVCRGLYAVRKCIPNNGLVLFHVAAHLRAGCFNYLSLETVLSDAGVISQIPINCIFLMSSGRTNRISCSEFGTIEFIHTQRKPEDLLDHLFYDAECRLWRSDMDLALRDMKTARRNCDLIDWEVFYELKKESIK
jgi:hypothetical protein